MTRIKNVLSEMEEVDDHPAESCPYKFTLHNLCLQSERIDAFIHEAEPLLIYVKGEIKRNEQRASMYLKITENVLGAGILFFLSALGAWAMGKFKI